MKCLFPLALASTLALSALRAETNPSTTTTREEKLLSVELGTLMAANEKAPTTVLATLKTDKQSYYLMATTISSALKDLVNEWASMVSQGAALARQNGGGGVTLHILCPLRYDGSDDNKQADVGFYPDRARRPAYNSMDWAYRRIPRFDGLCVFEFPATIDNSKMVYQRVSTTEMNVTCFVETQQEKLRDVNTFMDDRITYAPPAGLTGRDANHQFDNASPFDLPPEVIRTYSDVKDQTQVVFIVMPVGLSIGNGKALIRRNVALDELKPLMEKEYKDQFANGSMRITRTKLAGIDAWNITGTLKKDATMNFSETWLFEEPNMALLVRVMGKDKTLFDAATDSFPSIKIAPPKQ